VVLAASACESARILLNSRSPRFPNGLANGSGVVGRYLTDTVGVAVNGTLPQLSRLPAHNHDGTGGGHVYTPWWLYEKERKPDFPRGYHVEYGGGPRMPGVGILRGAANRLEGYGVELKRALRGEYGVGVGMSGRGEMIPNERSYCEIDPHVVDRYGIPVLRFHWQWGEPEHRMAAHMRRTFEEVITTMGGKILPGPRNGPTGTRRGDGYAFSRGAEINPGGSIIHEIGCVRMGSDPKTSVLNQYSQAHEVKNLFLADGGPFVSNPDKNPTLTILALSWRTSDYILDQAKKGNL
jgi:choline dehydrogenase-like flavoprotein